jgi:NADPH:quinone reductase-like Zn-dependent oxidoreductase
MAVSFPADRYVRAGATEAATHEARGRFQELDADGQVAEAERVAGLSDADLAAELGDDGAYPSDPSARAMALLPDDQQPTGPLPADSDAEQAGALTEATATTGTYRGGAETAGNYDPAEHTVAEVEDHLRAHPDERDAVIEAERGGKARTSLIGDE